MDISRGSTSRQPSQHPRRPLAHQSVSLRQSQDPRISPVGPASDQANPPSSISPKFTSHKQSSGESSDAGNWFEKTNKDAVQNNASFLDNDPPFFLRNSSSSETPPEGHEFRPTHKLPHSTIMTHRPNIQRRITEGSSVQDFRGVIDDLTIANKKLKQKLRKYEKLHDSHLQDEKLFEVRFHGLPVDKKRQLEEYLRKFAAELESPDTSYPQASYAPPLVPNKSTHSHTSRVAESGYASMSVSGQNSSSAPNNQESDARPMSKSQYNQQQQNVRSYLHDIPSGLLPKRNTPMTDKSKKKLVVQRLEQIFAGKRSVPGNHPQQMQQEKVAQSAAKADRRAKEEATGQLSKDEGQREARIMHSKLEEVANANPLFALPGVSSKEPSGPQANEQDHGSGSPDQRPTRPLDLDPFRAQVPAENMQYIRHLGFTPPDVTSDEAPQEGHGWLYLNLLINMAQLHTINVTPDFVKEAVSEYSSKFELSSDGRKVRWRGDQRAVPSSVSSSEVSTSPSGSLHAISSMSPTKHPKSRLDEGSTESVIEIERRTRRALRAAKRRQQGKLAYEPIFFHKDSDDEDDYYNLNASSSYNSPFPAKAREDSSGFTSSGVQSSSSRKRRDDGPMIFYNKANFCTDLSADRQSPLIGHQAKYKADRAQPLGAVPHIQSSTPHLNTDISEPRGPLDNATIYVDSKEGEKTSSSEEDIRFHPTSLRGDNASDESADIMDFEASGLGGVQPDDNFAIKVRRSRTQTTSSALSRARQHKPRYTKKILDILDQRPRLEGEHIRKQPMIREEILSSSKKSLPSSALPPASFLPFSSPSEYDDEDSGSKSDVSSSPSLHSTDADDPLESTTGPYLPRHVPPTHIGAMHTVAATNEESSSKESSEDDSDDDSIIDFLATARTLDPQTVLASEREYDVVVAERLAEVILAGSSAATAGYGSGFNSPVEMDIVRDNTEGSTSNTNNFGSSNPDTGEKQTGSLKRTRTDDSVIRLQKQKAQKK